MSDPPRMAPSPLTRPIAAEAISWELGGSVARSGGRSATARGAVTRDNSATFAVQSTPGPFWPSDHCAETFPDLVDFRERKTAGCPLCRVIVARSMEHPLVEVVAEKRTRAQAAATATTPSPFGEPRGCARIQLRARHRHSGEGRSAVSPASYQCSSRVTVHCCNFLDSALRMAGLDRDGQLHADNLSANHALDGTSATAIS